LLALRELVINNLLDKHVTPVVEPVKLSSTLNKTIQEYIKANHLISVISNPAVGGFVEALHDVKDGSKEASYRSEFLSLCENPAVIKSLILQEDAQRLLQSWGGDGVNEEDLLLIVNNRDALDLYERFFCDTCPRFVFIPDESAFRRRVRHHRVLLDDKFIKQSKNADYQKETDEFFSDDHLFYKEDGFEGFSDYSVVGDEYLEAGFAPYAVAIHIVYFGPDKRLKVKHFVSNSNEDITNPAHKFYEAVKKLANWYSLKPHPVEQTLGLQTFLQHYEQQTYPGLGTVKKLSLMHHLELIGRYLKEVA
jgi:hypothetical protein